MLQAREGGVGEGVIRRCLREKPRMVLFVCENIDLFFFSPLQRVRSARVCVDSSLSQQASVYRGHVPDRFKPEH